MTIATSDKTDITLSTNSANAMISSSTGLMAITPSTDARREQNDDSGSGVGGIVAGCVIVFILIVVAVVCLIIFLMWYRTKKKGKPTKSGMCNHMHAYS